MRIDPKSLSDDELIAALVFLARDEKRHLVSMLRHLREMDRRHLAERRAYPSLFEYCVRELRLSEGDAIRRIRVARLCARFPTIYGCLGRGLLTLATAALIEPHLTRANRRKLLHAAWGLRTREVEALVASIAPAQEPPERTRFLGYPPDEPDRIETVTVAPGEPAAAEEIIPVSQRVLFSFTGDERLLASVERAKELLMNKHGDPDYEAVFTEAVGALLDKLDPERRPGKKCTGRPAGDPEGRRSRVPPSWVKRTVWARDSGYCTFRAKDGARCRSRAGLQYDHIIPWAFGGRSDDPANIRLLCRTHNQLEARFALGDDVMDRAASPRSEGTQDP
jgi:hypothetical protein